MNRPVLRENWLKDQLNEKFNLSIDENNIIPLAQDASFRQYFRILTPEKNFLLMDAPPNLENCKPFISIAQTYLKTGIRTPEIFSYDLEMGYVLLEDFGNKVLQHSLNAENAENLYFSSLKILPKIQSCQLINESYLPHFGKEKMLEELYFFKEWCLIKFVELDLSFQEEVFLNQFFDQLISFCMTQPQVGVHRDYHSRNLMILNDQTIGVLDFQDAVIGPLTYDLVSLLRDCYIAWPQKDVKKWLKNYYEFTSPHPYSFEQFQQWFDWQGIQRHLKAIFIFCRKYVRDHSTNYLSDIPRAINYVTQISSEYPQLTAFKEFIENRLLSILLEKINSLTVN